MNNNITGKEYNIINSLYEFFNTKLFFGKLPGVLFTFEKNHGGVYGFYRHRGFVLRGHPDTQLDEISLNPVMFYENDIQIIQIVGHEMVHQWQTYFGTPGREYYHNKEWAAKMIDIGLMPSHTGEPGGNTTGQHMADYVIHCGRFEVLSKEFLKEFGFLSWAGVLSMPKKSNNKKLSKYTCPCGVNVWGKAHLDLSCNNCGEKFSMVQNRQFD